MKITTLDTTPSRKRYDVVIIGGAYKRKIQEDGIEYIQNEVVPTNHSAMQVDNVTLKSGDTISVGKVVNAASPRAR